MMVRTHRTLRVSSGAQNSAELDLSSSTVVGLQFPAAMTSTSITFLVAEKTEAAGGTFTAMIDGLGADLSYTIAASKYLPLEPRLFAGVNYLKLRTGSAEGADRDIRIFFRQIT